MNESINGNLSVPASADTNRMNWTSSPSGSVWRKRVHRVGPPEAGQVTSVVRYEPQSKFPAHDHPDGEEILVLGGVFSDEHGDWPAGTYLLNPEGFRHAPFSEPGCLLFVKLRQFPGRERKHVAIDTNQIDWQAGEIAGVEHKLLYRQAGFTDETELQRWQPHAELEFLSYPAGAELYVIDGAFQDESGLHGAGCWLRFPPGARHRPQTESGCTLYIKRGGFAYLKDAGDVSI